MMKLTKALILMAVLTVGALMTTSCGTPFPLGCLYTQITLPVTVGNGDIVYNRVGKSECYSILDGLPVEMLPFTQLRVMVM